MKVLLVCLNNGERAVVLNNEVILTIDANETRIDVEGTARKLARALDIPYQSISMDAPPDSDWNWDDIIEILPPDSDVECNYFGFLMYEGVRIDVAFAAPASATQVDKDAAFMAALAQEADIDYVPVAKI